MIRSIKVYNREYYFLVVFFIRLVLLIVNRKKIAIFITNTNYADNNEISKMGIRFAEGWYQALI